MATIDTTFLTHDQIKRKCTASVKRWIKEKGYSGKLQVYCTRGTFHINNCGNYMLSAKQILETATGLEFNFMTSSMARLKNK